MLALKLSIIACACSLMAGLSLLGGCSAIPEHYTEVHRDKLTISQSEQTPAVTVPYGVTSTGEGTLKGAGKGFGACIEGGVQTRDPFGLLFGIIISPVCAVVGGVYGVATAEKEITAKTAGMNLLSWVNGGQLQTQFNHYLTEYAAQQGIDYVNTVPTSGKPQPDTVAAPELRKFRLAVSISDITLERIKKGKKPEQDLLCLRIGIKGDIYRHDSKAPVSMVSTLSCKTQHQWRDTGIQAMTDLVDGYLKRVAAILLDDTYLVYYPKSDVNAPLLKMREEALSSAYPPYVLAAIQPAMVLPPEKEAEAVDPRKKQFLTGLMIPVAESLQPVLRWETFPMPWDSNLQKKGIDIQNVRYDLKVYAAKFTGKHGLFIAGWYVRGRLLYEKDGLRDAVHRVAMQLSPCQTYFWTVRARFLMDGASRVTEWGGIYKAGVYPWDERMHSANYGLYGTYASRYFYYMFKTPAADVHDQCSD